MQTDDQQICFICGRRANKGIRIFAMFLCFSCEQEIVRLSQWEPGYDTYRRHVKKIWKQMPPLQAGAEK